MTRTTRTIDGDRCGAGAVPARRDRRRCGARPPAPAALAPVPAQGAPARRDERVAVSRRPSPPSRSGCAASPDDAAAMAALGLAYVQQARVTADPALYAKAEDAAAARGPRRGARTTRRPRSGWRPSRPRATTSAPRCASARRATAIAPYDGAVVRRARRRAPGARPVPGGVPRVPADGRRRARPRVLRARLLRARAAGRRRRRRGGPRVASGVAPSADDEAFVWFHLGELAWRRGALAGRRRRLPAGGGVRALVGRAARRSGARGVGAGRPRGRDRRDARGRRRAAAARTPHDARRDAARDRRCGRRAARSSTCSVPRRRCSRTAA